MKGIRVKALLLAFTVSIAANAADTRLLDALRRNDVAAVRELLTSGADPNVRDAAGTSALMYATIYGSSNEMQFLLDRGADPNAANANGSTALMWAAGDTNKLNLLLRRGASVSAKTKNGTTALLAAAHHGNVQGVRRLVASGATPGDTTTIGLGFQSLALFRTDNSVERLLSAARMSPSLPARPSDSPLSNTVANAPLIRKFLDLGADPNEAMPLVTREIPAVAYAAYTNQLETLRQLTARGAKVNTSDSYGTTPLMMAAGSPRPDPATVRFLLDRGAQVNARDKSGRTPLDWALLQGDTAVVPVLRSAGAVPGAPHAAPPPVSSARSARDAMALAIARLQPVGPTFNQRHRCISCHNQSLPALAVALARRHDVPVDPTLATHPTAATLAMWDPAREQLLLGSILEFPGFVANVTYGLLAFAEEGVAPSPVTDAVVVGLAAAQNRDGSWFISDIRAPIGDSSAMSFTALAIRGLDTYAMPGRRVEMQERITRAREFLRRARPANTQDEAFKLMGLVWSRAPAAEVRRQSERLLKLQRADGGWAQTPTMTSDAYSTGQALYSLHSAGTASAAAAYRNGVQFLLGTQLEDGTWFVRSRAFGFQPYFDSGFPHGRDQFISAAATSWAVIALSYFLS